MRNQRNSKRGKQSKIEESEVRSQESNARSKTKAKAKAKPNPEEVREGERGFG